MYVPELRIHAGRKVKQQRTPPSVALFRHRGINSCVLDIYRQYSIVGVAWWQSFNRVWSPYIYASIDTGIADMGKSDFSKAATPRNLCMFSFESQLRCGYFFNAQAYTGEYRTSCCSGIQSSLTASNVYYVIWFGCAIQRSR